MKISSKIVSSFLYILLCSFIFLFSSCASSSKANLSLQKGEGDHFKLGPSLNIPRAGHSAVLLQDGRVLIVGGRKECSPKPCDSSVYQAEIYDPKARQFKLTDSLKAQFESNKAFLMADGKVALIDKQVQYFDPKTETFFLSGEMIQPRSANTATLLKNGKILITGGGQENTIFNTAELFDLATGKFSSAGAMKHKRLSHTAILLQDGRVLFLGGREELGKKCIENPEIYDPHTEKITPSKARMTCRGGYTPVLLPDGRVLLHGGNHSNRGHVFESLPDELYLPDQDKFITSGKIKKLIVVATVNVLPDGRVLYTGGSNMGFGAAAMKSTSEIYDPQSGTYQAGPSMVQKRGAFTQTVLQDGRVLITGGELSSKVIDSSEIWEGK